MDLTFILLMVGMIAVFYFVAIRPQSKRRKETQNLQANLNKGDEIITIGGIVGKINRVDEQYVFVETTQNTTLKMTKTAIQSQLPKGTVPQE